MDRRKIVTLCAPIFGAVVGALASIFIKGAGGPAGDPFHGTAWYSLDDAFQGRWAYLGACGAAWVLFSIYWETAAKNAAPAKSSESGASRGLHVFLTNAALVLVIAPLRGLGRFLPASALVMAAGVLLTATGLFLAIWARRHLGRNWSGAITIKVEHRLIRTGPYRVLRHPIYTGLLAMYVGSAIATGEWLAVLGVAMAGFAYWRKIRLEEAALDAAFGAEYDEYRRQSSALVPGLY